MLRPCDRLQFRLSILLLFVLVIGLPTASLSAGLAAYRSEMHTVRVQAAERHQVTARLITDSEGTGAARQWAQVRWADRGGPKRTGLARAARGTPNGTIVRIWVDREGTVTEAPVRPADATATGWITGCVTAGAVFAMITNARAGLAHVLDRRRYARWGAEWDRLEPQWSGRSP
ncbi:hypothetical protein KN815_17340 [Streptomyces sp. 4503]|uniref:Membrane protein SCJ1.26 n=1 Tax=Streptomyces niphimycinicus TaxID=2842201 RepID=A0ABS6CFX4_9ACTN|nr:hypothetical protein [Streptomyces niphimycinicus]